MTTWIRLCTVDPVFRAALNRSIRKLGTTTASMFPAHIRLADALAYIGENGRWHYSNWWREMDDVFFEVTDRCLHDYFNDEIAPRLHGEMTAKENDDDGTPRIVGTARDAVQWAVMMLNRGGDLLAPDLVDRVLGGGPDGTGQPYPLEGMQVHLIRGGKAWEFERGELANVPDGFAARDGNASDDHGHGLIAGFPSVNLALAYRGGTPARVLPALFHAVIR